MSLLSRERQEAKRRTSKRKGALKEIRDENAAVHVLCPRQDALRRAVAQNQSLVACCLISVGRLCIPVCTADIVAGDGNAIERHPSLIGSIAFPSPATMSAVQTGMHSLPTEIKQQIARCCATSSFHWRDTAARATRDWFCATARRSASWRGQSIALSRGATSPSDGTAHRRCRWRKPPRIVSQRRFSHGGRVQLFQIRQAREGADDVGDVVAGTGSEVAEIPLSCRSLERSDIAI
jgi:hypothetical protein